MNEYSTLNSQTIPLFAAKNYDNPHCQDMDEFYVDLNRLNSIKKLLNRYVRKNDLRLRILLNHIVIFHNLFGEATARILFASMDMPHYPTIKALLEYLNILPGSIPETNLDAIELDWVVYSKLENL